MRLSKEEALWLADKFYDIFYALNVDEMYEKDQVFKTLYGNEYEYEVWSYNDALQKIKNLVQQVEGIQ
jgi:hypothetical protein